MDRLEVTITWHDTVLDMRHLAEGDGCRVGEDALGLDAVLPVGWQLAELREGHARVRAPEGVEVHHLQGGAVARLPPADSVRGLALGRGERARFALGDFHFLFAVVPAAPALPKRRWRDLWRGNDLRGFGAAAVLHGLVLALAASLPVDAAQLSLDQLDTRPEWVDVLIKPQQAIPDPQPDPVDPVEGGDDPIAGGPAPADRPPPRPSAPRRSADPAADRAAQLAKARAAAADVAAGLNLALGDVMGTPTLGAQAMDALNGMNGTSQGDPLAMHAGDPLGSPWGAGPGGPGGAGPGPSIGLTGLDRRAFRRGPPGGPGGPGGPGAHGTRKTKLPPGQIVPLEPRVSDGLAREEIQRVIRRNRARFRVCYERALQREADLNGKVSTRFTIGPDGAVIAALIDESTLGHAEVEACLVAQLKRTAFPAPRGRGVVVVRYPFLFKRSGR